MLDTSIGGESLQPGRLASLAVLPALSHLAIPRHRLRRRWGSISPTGVTTCLKRATAFFTIVPEVGNHILEEKVVGVSVGAVSSYKFTKLTTEPVAAITPALPEQPAFKHRHDSWQYGNP